MLYLSSTSLRPFDVIMASILPQHTCVAHDIFFSSVLQVEVKTKKLKKLWAKYQGAQQEAVDLQGEFQTERTDLVDTIRQLSQTIKLKDIIIANFIPEETSKNLEKRALWYLHSYSLTSSLSCGSFLSTYVYMYSKERRGRLLDYFSFDYNQRSPESSPPPTSLQHEATQA